MVIIEYCILDIKSLERLPNEIYKLNSGITYVADPKDEKSSIIKSFKNFLNKIHSTWEDSYYFNLNPDSFSFDSDRSIINEFVQADFIFDCSGLKCKLDRDTWLIYCTSNSKVFFMELSSLLSIKKEHCR